MAKIKGRYVAQVEIDYNFGEEEDGLLTFEQLRKNIKNNLTPELKKLIIEAVCSPTEGTVNVTQTYADVWKVEEGERECQS